MRYIESSTLSLRQQEFCEPVENKLPIALLGVGGYGIYHVNILLGLQQKGLIELAAVADPAISRLPEVRATLEEANVSCYEKPEELFRKERGIKAVSIAASIPWHEDLCRAALAQNLFIYLEKPPVPLIQQWHSLMRLDSNRRIAVAFQNIASSAIQTLKRWLLEGRLGSIKTIRLVAAWPRDTEYYSRNNWAGKLTVSGVPVFDGPATNGLAHLLHDAMFLASPQASGFALPLEVTAELYRARPIESYDTCCFRAILEGGIEVSAAFTHSCDELFPYRILVSGSKGEAWIDVDGRSLGNNQGWEAIHESHEDFRSRCYENFVLYALGQRSRPDTFLADTKGYLLLTNGMALSSGSIHPIAASHLSVTGKGQKSVYAIRDILKMVQSTLTTGRLFSEQGATWGVPGTTLRDLTSVSLNLDSISPEPTPSFSPNRNHLSSAFEKTELKSL